ncbi:MAG: PA0069 family radical SAM protein [Myxococcota bacterium]
MARPAFQPRNRFASEHVELDEPGSCGPVEVLEDRSRSILSRNDSPDVGFDWSVNPYRGCAHACAYCYARPSHEYLGFSAGTDFERKLLVKPDAPRLLREAFEHPSWNRELVLFSGVTDCYQPLESQYRLTRACLEVCVANQNPVAIVTKSPLVTRDVDVLSELSNRASVTISISIPVHAQDPAHAVEPRVATPQRRLKAIETLASAGLSVCLNVAPVIPGLTERDLDTLLRRASEAGATSAWYTFLRLPGAVRPVFEHAIRGRLPLAANKILGRVKDVRRGRLNDSRFHTRMTGEGPYAEAFQTLFRGLTRKYGLIAQTANRRKAVEENPIPAGAQGPQAEGAQAAKRPKMGRGNSIPAGSRGPQAEGAQRPKGAKRGRGNSIPAGAQGPQAEGAQAAKRPKMGRGNSIPAGSQSPQLKLF